MIFIKKLLALLLSVVALATLTVPVFADDDNPADTAENSQTTTVSENDSTSSDNTDISPETADSQDNQANTTVNFTEIKNQLYTVLNSLVQETGCYVFYDISIEEIEEGYNVTVKVIENQYIEQVLLGIGITDLSKADYILKNTEQAAQESGINYSLTTNDFLVTFYSEFPVQSLSEISTKTGLSGYLDFIAPESETDEEVYAVVLNKDLDTSELTQKTQYFNYALLCLTVHPKNNIVADVPPDSVIENSGGLNSYEWLVTPAIDNGMCIYLYTPPVFKTHFYIFAIAGALVYIAAFVGVSLFLKNKKSNT